MHAAAALLNDPRWRPAWAWLLLACALASAVFAFMPKPIDAGVGGADKLMHVAAFAAMAWCWALAGAGAWRRQAEALLGLLAWGVVIELVQSQLPSRSADAADVLADGLGIAAGLLLAATLRGALRTR